MAIVSEHHFFPVPWTSFALSHLLFFGCFPFFCPTRNLEALRLTRKSISATNANVRTRNGHSKHFGIFEKCPLCERNIRKSQRSLLFWQFVVHSHDSWVTKIKSKLIISDFEPICEQGTRSEAAKRNKWIIIDFSWIDTGRLLSLLRVGIKF